MITIDNLALWGTFLSGLGALSALIISIVQIKKNSKISEANFWLTLRESFNSPDRKIVHQDLRQGKWKNTSPSDNCEWVKIEDYMGLFEVCERMLERKIIDEKMFISLYEYRIHNIITNKELAKCKLIYEYYDWEYFYKLLSRLYGNDWIDFYKFLNTHKFEFNEVKSERDILQKFNEKEEKTYTDFLKRLKID